MSEKTNSSQPIEREVRCTLATLRVNSQTGWKRLVTVTRWGGSAGRFKLDIRDWSEDMSRSTKGLTMNRGEVEKLRNILSIMDMSLIDEGYASGQSGNDPYHGQSEFSASKNQTRNVPQAPAAKETVPEVKFAGAFTDIQAVTAAPVQNETAGAQEQDVQNVQSVQETEGIAV